MKRLIQYGSQVAAIIVAVCRHSCWPRPSSCFARASTAKMLEGKPLSVEHAADAAAGPRRPAARIQSRSWPRRREDQPAVLRLLAGRDEDSAAAGIRQPVRRLDDAALPGRPSARRARPMGQSVRGFVQSLRALLPRARLLARGAAVSARGRRVSRPGGILAACRRQRHADAPEHAGPLRSRLEPRVPVRRDGQRTAAPIGRKTPTRSSTKRRIRRRTTSASTAASQPRRAGWSKGWPRCSRRPAFGARNTTTRRPIA